MLCWALCTDGHTSTHRDRLLQPFDITTQHYHQQSSKFMLKGCTMELQTNNKKAQYFIMFQVSSHFILSRVPHCSGHTPPTGFRWAHRQMLLSVFSFSCLMRGRFQTPMAMCHNVLALATCFYSNDSFSSLFFPKFIY